MMTHSDDPWETGFCSAGDCRIFRCCWARPRCDCGTQEKCQVLVDAPPRSSLASYRIGEVFFEEGRYQNALNSLRRALDGDHDAGWVEVWAHLPMEKIFDLTGQRVRVLNEYRMTVWRW
jgi:hypothetical protein